MDIDDGTLPVIDLSGGSAWTSLSPVADFDGDVDSEINCEEMLGDEQCPHSPFRFAGIPSGDEQEAVPINSRHWRMPASGSSP